MEGQVKRRAWSEKSLALRSRAEPDVVAVRLRMRPTDGGSSRARPGWRVSGWRGRPASGRQDYPTSIRPVSTYRFVLSGLMSFVIHRYRSGNLVSTPETAAINTSGIACQMLSKPYP